MGRRPPLSNLWYDNHRRLSRGDRGRDVEKLQRALNAAGANPALNPNGIFGAETEAEVRAFQRRVDLIDDGLVRSRASQIVDYRVLLCVMVAETGGTIDAGREPPGRADLESRCFS